ncbi:MAG: tetratricopeptide repeat protein [Bacteroidales bacterium]|nr:tetratricopeptide repeat protein [Bacteroidales bacterium]
MQKNIILLISILLLIGSGNLLLGQASSIDSLQIMLSETKGDSVKSEIIKEILKHYVKSKDFDKAEEYAVELQQLATRVGSNDLLGKAWYNLGIVKWLKKEEVESNIYFEKSVPYIIDTPDSVLLGKCYTKIGTNYLRLSDFKNAILYYHLSFDVRQGLHDSTGMANNLINIAGCYYQMAEYDDAIRFYHDALKIAENTGNLKLMAYNFNNIGNVYMKTEDFTDAVEYIHKALEANRKLNDEREASKNLLNLAKAWQTLGDTSKAEQYFLESAGIMEKLNDHEGLSTTYNSLGSIYKNLREPDKALIYFLKAYDLVKLSNDKFEEATILANIGSVYLNNHHKKALEYYLKSIEIANEINARHLVMSGYEGLIEYHRFFGEYEKSLYYYELKTQLNDSIYNEKTVNAIAEMQTKYETEKKEKENEVLIRDIRIERYSKRFLIVLIGCLFLLLLAIIYTFRLNRKSLKQSKVLHSKEIELNQLELAKKELEKEHLGDKIFAEQQLNIMQRQKFEAEIEHKNHELANSALYIVNKNEVLSDLKEKIVSGTKAADNKNYLQEVIRMIDNNIDLDQNWQKFKLQFEEVNPGFFDRIKQKHPDLSDIYIKLSAYIRINITTNETAQLLNVTLAAVKKSRQRLRKKFGLAADDSLFDYISKI